MKTINALSLCILLTFLFGCGSGPSGSQNTAKIVKVGEVLKTDMFEVTVNKAAVDDHVNVGNEFADLKREAGVKYLIINVTFKNVDKESRMLVDGNILINYNGKDYKFDKSEPVMEDGWGLMLDQINPLTLKTTNLVYKLPAELKGELFWNPGRADEDQKIDLGNID